MKEITIRKDNFEKEVLNSDKPVLIDFWATWCGPCRMFSPVLAEIADEYEDKFKVGKINVDEQSELASQYRVSSIPAIMIFDKGKVVKSATGYHNKPHLEKFLGVQEE